jgi:exonuclease SbcC
VPGAGLPSEADLKARRQAVVDLEAALNKARDEFNDIKTVKLTAQSRTEDLEKELGENADIDLAVLRATAGKARELWSKARQAAETVAALEATVKKLKEREEAAGRQLETCQKEYQKANTELEAAQAVWRERELSVPENLRDAAALSKAQLEARHKRDRLTANFENAKKAVDAAKQALAAAAAAEKEAHTNWQAAVKLAEGEMRSFQKRLESAGFDGLKEYQEARKTTDEIKKMESEIKGFDESLHAARDRLARAAGAAEGLVEPDLEKLALDEAEAKKEHDQLLVKEGLLQSQVKEGEKSLKKLQELEGQLKSLEDR